jgi:PRD1 phage membrane DNA delivery
MGAVDKGIGVLIAIIGLAALAVIVSKRSNTAAVLTAFLNGFQKSVATAISPVVK